MHTEVFLYQQQQQQQNHLSQVFGVGYMNQKRITPDRAYGSAFSTHGISFKNYRSHSASFSALSKAMNSNFIVKRAIHVCIKDFQDFVAPLRGNMYPLVDFDSSESAIQLASLYPSSTGGYCSYLKAYFLACDT